MAIQVESRRNAGHPWDGRPGFDVLLIDADTKAEMDAAIADAERKRWKPWLIGARGDTGKPGAALYKPCGAAVSWHDSPEHRHLGNVSVESLVD